jgi:hypothetical protein
VPNELPDDAKTIAFDVILDSSRDINHSIADVCLGNPLVKRLFGHIHQLLRQHATASDCHRFRRVTNVTIVNYSNIKTYNVSELQDTWSSQTVDYLFIDRDTCVTGEFPAPTGISTMDIAQKCALCPVMVHSRSSELIYLRSGHAWLDEGGGFMEYGAGYGTGRTHYLKVPVTFEDNLAQGNKCRQECRRYAARIFREACPFSRSRRNGA